MEDIYRRRIDRVRKVLARRQLDTFLVLIEENRRYMSGFGGEDSGFDESAGALLISPLMCILATDSRFDLQARREAPLYQVVRYREGLVKELPRLLKKLKTRRLGFEGRRISYEQHQQMTLQIRGAGLDIDLVESRDIVEDLRIRKSRNEAAAMNKALRIAESAVDGVIRTIRPGMTESEAAWRMERHLRENGADGLSFPTIVASGPNSALPHAIPGDRKFKTGEPILFDWGVRFDGYCSDISRTVVIGKPGTMFKKVYAAVRDAQQKAIDVIRPGVAARTVDAAARCHIEQKGFKGRFGHGLGHGVGLAIHEAPRVSPLSDAVLKAGMVFTIEPGIYIPRWGGVRIENMVQVRPAGACVLNRLGTDDFRIEA